MKRIIGNEINVFLKSSVGAVSDICGMLIDVTDDSIYVQCLDSLAHQEVYIVPRDNIKYCTTKYLPSAERVLAKTAVNHNVEVPIIQEAKQMQQVQKQPECLNVFVNDELIASIPVPPTFNLNVWSDNIIRVIMGNPDVKVILEGKTQKSIEYFPGEVYIELTEEEMMPEVPVVSEEKENQNTFTMSGSDAASQFLNPSQMVSRLNAAVRRGKKNGNQTKV